MTHTHPFGKNEHVFAFSADDQVETNIEPLKKMLLHSKVKNRKIVAFSVIGGYRQGKSFFLDYCLRFLYANVSSFDSKLLSVRLICFCINVGRKILFVIQTLNKMSFHLYSVHQSIILIIHALIEKTGLVMKMIH